MAGERHKNIDGLLKSADIPASTWLDDHVNRLICGDCLDVMRSIPNKSIDMILCDLPYGTTACKWDTVIPFEPLWEAYNRIIKDNGAIVLTASQPFTTALISSNKKMFKNELIWKKQKGTNFLLCNKQPMKCHENIIVFCKSQPVYNPQFTKGEPYANKSDFSYTGEIYGHKMRKPPTNCADGRRYPLSIIDIHTERGLHPTQKPVALFEWLIKTYTNEGALVLDNCIGSGTTAIACMNTKRNFIGIELDEKYCEIAKRRIEEAESTEIKKKRDLHLVKSNITQDSPEQRRQIPELLLQAGITEDDFEFYIQQFASNRSPYLVPFRKKFCRGKEEGITNLQIARHLAELWRYGVSCGAETDHFVIDVDYKDHSPAGTSDFHRRFEQIIKLFPTATIIQSSDSGGLHAYVFLDHPESTNDINQFVLNRFKNHDLDLKSGKFELFTLLPRRLPFGKCSYVLSPETLTRATCSKSEDIWYIRNISDRRTLEEIFEESDRVCIKQPEQIKSVSVVSKQIKQELSKAPLPPPFISSVRESTKHNSDFIQHCERLLERGLDRDGTRYFACSNLIEFFMFVVGHNPEQTHRCVVDWLSRKHNGFSNEYNQSPESVFKIIESQVRWFTKNGPVRLRRVGLSRREISLILLDGISYHEQCFLFDLFRWWKRHHGNEETARIYSRIFWKFKGSSNESYVKRRQKAYELGYLQKIRGHLHDEKEGFGVPILYRIHVEFDLDPRNNEFFDIDQAIIALLSPQEIKRRYSNYKARQLLRLQIEKERKKE